MSTPEQFQRAAELFAQALKLDSNERADFLKETCGQETELLDEVESLLAHDDEESEAADNILSGGKGIELLASDLRDEHTTSPDERVDTPDYIGRYRIIREIGRGGMGVVYEAEQADPKRRVALKVMREGFASREVQQRFRREAQLLGRLQHPGIAHIYEAGTEHVGGRPIPYFAMEYIEGDSLDKHVRASQFSHRDILQLFVRICDAVQHAHQKGIIHRDLKPSNVLVKREATDLSMCSRAVTATGTGTVIDAIGQPKILDFGVARFSDQSEQATLQTHAGQLVGTLAYMSPEQLDGDPAALDTRCDVYAMGVMLYRMLAGKLPVDIAGKPVAESVRLVRDTEPKRLGQIVSAFRGDIETIVAKAIEKDPARRYDSAAALADDLRRHLAHEPISAHPPNAIYQIGKFTRRNKALVGGIITTILALAIGLVGTSYYLVDAVEQRNTAQTAIDELNVVVDFQYEILSKMSARKVGTAIVNDLRGEFMRGIEEANLAKNDREKAIATFDGLFEHVNATNVARNVLSNTIADRAIREIDSGFAENALTEARLRCSASGIYENLGMNQQAIEQLRIARELSREHINAEHGGARTILLDLAVMQQRMGMYVEAEANFRELIEVARQRLGNDHHRTMRAIIGLGQALFSQDRLNEAAECFQEVLEAATRTRGPANKLAVGARNNLAALEAKRGRIDEALEQFQALLVFQRERYGNGHPRTIKTLNNVMAMLFKGGRLAEAETYARQTVDAYAESLGDENPSTIMARNNLGRVVLDLGKATEAAEILRPTYAVALANLAPTNEIRDKCHSNLIDALLAQGSAVDAETQSQELLAIRRQLNPPRPDSVAQTLEQLGWAFFNQRRFDDARIAWQECLDLRLTISADHWLTQRAQSQLGAALTALDRFDEAETMLTTSYATLCAQRDAIPKVAGAGCVAAASERIITLYERWGKPERIANWRKKLQAGADARGSAQSRSKM